MENNKWKILIMLVMAMLLTGCNQDLCKNGHSWEEATCEQPKTCSVCKISHGTVANHSYGEYAVVVPATCFEEGCEEAYCLWCGAKDERAIQMLEHTTEWNTVTNPTINTDGLKNLECKNCGEIVESEIIPATGITSPVLSQNNSIGAACDYISSANSDLLRAKKICTNIATMYQMKMFDNSAYTLYNDAYTLAMSAKDKVVDAKDIFSNNNSNYQFQGEISYALGALQIINMAVVPNKTPYNDQVLYQYALSLQSMVDNITRDLNKISVNMIKKGY